MTDSTQTVIPTPDELARHVGEVLGVSDWITIDQARIDGFATVTDDHQWIHTDPERAATGPFGATIAHGFLTLALIVPLVNQVVRVDGARMAVNYGLDRVRFPAPVPVGSRVRARVELTSVAEVTGGVQAVRTVTMEIDGSARPACVTESIVRYLR